MFQPCSPARAVAILNEALRLDPDAIDGLFSLSVPAKAELTTIPGLHVRACPDPEAPGEPIVLRLSAMGVINGFFGLDPDGNGAIAACWEQLPEGGERLVGFGLRADFNRIQPPDEGLITPEVPA